MVSISHRDRSPLRLTVALTLVSVSGVALAASASAGLAADRGVGPSPPGSELRARLYQGTRLGSCKPLQ